MTSLAVLDPKKATDVPGLMSELFSPHGGLQEVIDEKLFGDPIHRLGLDPGALVIDDIQYKLLISIYEALQSSVENGRREEIRPTLKALLTKDGDKFRSIIARAEQYHEGQARQIREKAKIYQRRKLAEANREDQNAKFLADINAQVLQARRALQTALERSIILDESTPEAIHEARDVLEAIKPLKQKLISLKINHKEILLNGRHFEGPTRLFASAYNELHAMVYSLRFGQNGILDSSVLDRLYSEEEQGEPKKQYQQVFVGKQVDLYYRLGRIAPDYQEFLATIEAGIGQVERPAQRAVDQYMHRRLGEFFSEEGEE